MRPQNHALIVIDVQNDFCPGGALAVHEGDQIVGQVNDLMTAFGAVIFTQDWHPVNHSSFATNHAGKNPFDLIEMPYGSQVLWPTHCVQATPGSEFHADLNTARADLIIRKGFNSQIDSYSAFCENDQTTPTGLHGYLQTRGIDTVTLAGLATDFCVSFSAQDAARLGYDTTVIQSACRAIDMDGSLAVAQKKMATAGVKLLA